MPLKESGLGKTSYFLPKTKRLLFFALFTLMLYLILCIYALATAVDGWHAIKMASIVYGLSIFIESNLLLLYMWRCSRIPRQSLVVKTMIIHFLLDFVDFIECVYVTRDVRVVCLCVYIVYEYEYEFEYEYEYEY